MHIYVLWCHILNLTANMFRVTTKKKKDKEMAKILEKLLNAQIKENIEISIHKMPKPLIPLFELILEEIRDIERQIKSTDLIKPRHG